ncbi:MAG: anion permease [Burkholderiales bacterium]
MGETRAGSRSPLQPALVVPLIITLGIGVALWFTPPPEGINPQAWHLFAIFVATVAGFIAKPLPMGAVAMIGMMAIALTGTLSIDKALSGFGNTVIWLIGAAFFVSRAVIKTGLGARIAYYFMRLLGKKTLGLSYGLGLADLILAPAMPSNTAREGGIIMPLVRSVAEAYDSTPARGTERKIGSFLMLSAFQINIITSAMFMTAMAANPLAAELASGAGVKISWGDWFLAALLPGVVSLILVPMFVYKFYGPEIKETPAARELAEGKLREMGPISPAELVTAGVIVLMLVLWVGGQAWKINATTAAFVGVAVLLLSGALTWDDMLKETGAWDTIVWFAALVMMATQLNTLGFIPWIGKNVGALVGGFPWATAFLLLALVYFYSHYMFASQTAHISAMYAPFLAVALAAGTPPVLAALVLAFFSNLFSSLTHYANGPAPVVFGTRYVSMGAWWGIGAAVSVLNIIIWVGVGSIWWKMIGLM